MSDLIDEYKKSGLLGGSKTCGKPYMTEKECSCDLCIKSIKDAKFERLDCFCVVCNFAITKAERDNARFDYDCPNCHQSTISRFYSYGSQYHFEAWEDYKESRGMGVVSYKIPPAFPQDELK